MSTVEHERSRCLRLVEACIEEQQGYARSLAIRLSNIIRNGIAPESLALQLASDEATEYAEPGTAGEERERCLQCLRMHFDDRADDVVKTMMARIEREIIAGQ